MDALRIIAENKIEAAQAEGVFDDLEGNGKPIRLEASYLAGDENFMANHILRTNRFLPIWLEDRKQLQQEIAACHDQIQHGGFITDEKREAIRQLNHRISGYNLRVPVDSLRLLSISVPE
jgi:hypothetical protein